MATSTKAANEQGQTNEAAEKAAAALTEAEIAYQEAVEEYSDALAAERDYPATSSTTGRAQATNASKMTRTADRPELIRRVRRRKRIKQRREKPLSDAERKEQNARSKKYTKRARKLLSFSKKIAGTKKAGPTRIKAMVALAWLWPLVFIQIFMAVVSMIGFLLQIAGESSYAWSFLSGAVQSDLLSFGGYGATVATGLLSMIAGVAILSARGIRCFHKGNLTTFMWCSFCYFIPFANVIPWVYVYGWNIAKK